MKKYVRANTGGKSVYVVIELPTMQSDVPKLVGVFSSKSAAESAAYKEDYTGWRNIIPAVLDKELI